MIWKRWTFQYVIVTLVLFFFFTTVQYLKNRSLDEAVQFGIIWAFITATVFFMVRGYRAQGCKRSNKG